MSKRVRYPLIILSLLAIVHFFVHPYLYQLLYTGRLTMSSYRLLYLSINLVFTVALAVFIFIKGRFIRGIPAIAGLIAINAVLDALRIYVYPEIAINSNVISTFAGVFIFSFSLVSVKKAIFKKRAGLFFVLMGAIYMLRFPMFMDFLHYFLNKYYSFAVASDVYFQGTLYLNYMIIGLALFALDGIIHENKAMDRTI